MGWWDGMLAALCVASCCTCAVAQERPGRAAICGGDVVARGSAGRTIDGRTFALDDGREVRLAGIEVPPVPHPQDTGVAPGGTEAREALAALLAAGAVVLKRAEIPSDRYGRVLAFAFVSRDGVERFIQAELIAAGQARVAARSAPAIAPRNFSAAKTPRVRPSLAFGPIRIMNCLTPPILRTCWPSEAVSAWSRAKWCPCAKAAPPFM
jgi:endonuclease YncB( thermonuclease family)